MSGPSLPYPKTGNRVSAITLDNVRVASPCPASWENMTGDDRIRYCEECKLNVYNLSDMTRAEAERLISGREGRLCVRFYRRADGTVLTQDCPKGLQAMMRRVSRVAGAVLTTIMGVSFAMAQEAILAPAQSATKNDQKPSWLSVTVVDPTGAVIPGAQISLLDEKSQKTSATVTDANGLARFSHLDATVYVISVSARYFQSQQQTVKLGAEPLALSMTLPLAHTQGVMVVVEGGDIPTESVTPPVISPYPIQPLPKEKGRR
jgi:hypothetical protein